VAKGNSITYFFSHVRYQITNSSSALLFHKRKPFYKIRDSFCHEPEETFNSDRTRLDITSSSFFCLDMIISSMKILHNFRSKEGTTSLCTGLVLSCARANTKPDLYFAFNPTVIHHAKNEGSALPLVH
jgi:hypothetical protein